MWICARFVLLVAGILVVNLHLAIRYGEFAAPIVVKLEGFREKELASARLLSVYLHSDQLVTPTRPGCWECPRRCTVEVALYFPEPLQSTDGTVHVAIGGQSFKVPIHELNSQNGVYLLLERLESGASPGFATCRNWPGTEAFVHYYIERAAPGVGTVLALVLALGIGLFGPWREGFAAMVGLSEPLDPQPSQGQRPDHWNWAGWMFLIGGFAFLECMQPYYFTQDDALVGELPGILLGCRNIWEGTFPDWNPYVLMGAPLATIGFWAVTYPPQLLSYAIARHVLGNEFATLEVFAALHLLAGFIAMRHLCRRIGMSGFTSNLAALSFVFSGCILIMGRSWQPFVANAVWLPLLGIAIQRFREGPVGWKWIAGVGLTLGLAYHSGFPQIVAILGMFFVAGLAAVTLGERLPLRRLAPVAPALLLGIGLSAPLLLHHLEMTGGHDRFVPIEKGIYDNLAGAVSPYPYEAGFATDWGSFHHEKLGHFYFFGGVFAVLFALQAVAFWIFLPDRQAWARAWWVPCGIVAFLMVLGEPGYLWQGLGMLPMSKFFLRYSFRFYPWLAFCAILSGGLVLEQFLAMVRRREPWEFVAGGLMLAVLAYHLMMCQPSFYSYGFQPYPPLPAEFEAAFHPYGDKSYIGDRNSKRIASWAELRSVSPNFPAGLPLNLPHHYQTPSVFGYDPIVEGQADFKEVLRRIEKDPLEACRRYGIGWHLFTDGPVHSSSNGLFRMESTLASELGAKSLRNAELTTIARHEGVTLKELLDVDPLAFVTDRPSRPLPMHLHGRGADIEVGGLAAGTRVTINFLMRPHMSLLLDDQPITIDKDDWNRITTTLPESGAVLSLRYEPPWRRTCGIGAALCFVALVLAGVTIRLNS